MSMSEAQLRAIMSQPQHMRTVAFSIEQYIRVADPGFAADE